MESMEGICRKCWEKNQFTGQQEEDEDEPHAR